MVIVVMPRVRVYVTMGSEAHCATIPLITRYVYCGKNRVIVYASRSTNPYIIQRYMIIMLYIPLSSTSYT